MSMLNKPPGSYQEERLWLLAQIEDLQKDVNAMHVAKRELKAEVDRQSRHLLQLKIRAGGIAAGCGSVVAVLIELGKHWFSR